jgi:deazaflavin-dependent oxidoreductase (nitroreductase family)
MTSTDGATLARPSRSPELLRAISRATGPISRRLAGHRFLPLWAVLRHRGRRTGREYAVPVAIRATEEAFVIGNPFGERTQWVRNVVDAGGCTIRWQAAEHPATAPAIIGYEEAARRSRRHSNGSCVELACHGSSGSAAQRRAVPDGRSFVAGHGPRLQSAPRVSAARSARWGVAKR